MIIVPTIRHTGTHFLLKLLGIHPKGMLWTEQENGIAYGHIYPDRKHTYLPLIRDNLTIIPLRHPFVVAKSWIARNGDLNELVAMWELLVNEIDPLFPAYLPIDSPYRDDHLVELKARTGLYLKTDWEPVGSVNNNHKLRHDDMEPDNIVIDLVDRISGFLSRFYSVVR